MPFGVETVKNSVNNPTDTVIIGKTSHRPGSSPDFAERAFNNIGSANLPANKNTVLFFNRYSQEG